MASNNRLLVTSPEPFAHADEEPTQHVSHFVCELDHCTDVFETDANTMINQTCDYKTETKQTQVHKKIHTSLHWLPPFNVLDYHKILVVRIANHHIFWQ